MIRNMNRNIELLAPGGDVEAIKQPLLLVPMQSIVAWITLTPGTGPPTLLLMTYPASYV